jgi:hypothetical protein
MSEADEFDGDDELSLDEILEGRNRAVRSGSDLIADAALTKALGASGRRLLATSGPDLVLITVPSEAWVAPIAAAAKRLAPGAVTVGVAKPHRPSSGGDPALKALDAILVGRRALVVSHSPRRLLPPVLLAAADLQVSTALPDVREIRRVIRGWDARRSGCRLRAEDLVGLDLPDLAAAFRPGSSAGEVAGRMRSASRSLAVEPASAVPPLDRLVGGGEALDWALLVAADLARAKAGDGPRERLQSAILHGPPGTGKTTLARAIAHHSGIPLVTTNVGEWFSASNGHLDGVIKAQNDFFHRLAVVGPCVGFVDELDALRDRVTLGSRDRGWWTPMVTNYLLQLDDVRRLHGSAVLVGATNNFTRLDAALVRPGRFDRCFELSLPTEEELAEILRWHLGTDRNSVDAARAARIGAGGTGAAAEAWVRSARARARAAGRTVTTEDVLAAIAPPDPPGAGSASPGRAARGGARRRRREARDTRRAGVHTA